MRDKIILILLIITVFIGSLASSTILANAQATMISILNQIGKDTSIDDFNNIKNTWDNLSTPWHLFINQKDIDDINLNLSKLEVYVKQKDHANISLIVAILNTLLYDIVEREKLTWHNII